MAATLEPLEVRPLTARIGAEVFGVDLHLALDAAVLDRLHAELLRWKVLFFRGTRVDEEHQLALASELGTAVRAPRDAVHESATSAWITELSFLDRPPSFGVLRAVEVPAVGGDTLWANTATAYQELPPEVQALADSLEVVHASVAGGVDGYESAHPVVRVVPETRERALLLGGLARRIVGAAPQTSDALLRLFSDVIQRPENTVRWRWRAGDVALWDQRATQQCVVADFGRARRELDRVIVLGELPRGTRGRTSRLLRGEPGAPEAVEVA